MTRRAKGKRSPLSRDRVLRAALELADEGGIGALTMQQIGRRLGVEAMSLYRHVRNKDDILDGIVDLVFAEIELPADRSNWRTALQARSISARAALVPGARRRAAGGGAQRRAAERLAQSRALPRREPDAGRARLRRGPRRLHGRLDH